MKKLMKRSFGFTLVELIVVITILAILGTIAFISLQGYSKNARDSARISDIENIVTSFTLYEVQRGSFPVPSDGVEITYLGGSVWTQGTIGESVITNLSQMSKKPIDPFSSSEYTYSRLNSKKEYQIAAVLEGGLAFESNNTFSSAHAAGNLAGTAYVKGNYNGMLAKVNTGGILYTLAVPTLISGDITVTSLTALQAANKLVYKGAANLPASYESSNFKVDGGGFVFNPSDIVVYTGSMGTLSDITNRVQLVEALKNVYIDTDASDLSPDIQTLTSTAINSEYATSEAELLASNIIKNSINPSIDVTIVSETKFLCNGADHSTAYNANGGFFNVSNFPNTQAFAALKNDGSISVWGDDSYGGSGALAPSDNGYIKVTSNETAFAALKGDGTITVWGNATNGGSGGPSGGGFVDVFSSSAAFAALKDDGSIQVWGDAGPGVQEVALSDTEYTKIYSSNYSFAALKEDGTIYAWGSYPGIGDVPGVSYLSVSATTSAFAGLKSDGSIYSWGLSGHGGSGAPAATGYTSISATERAFAALNSDGSIFVWGDDSYGGTGAIDPSGYTNVYANFRAFAATKTDGSITVWGSSSNGGSLGFSGTGTIKIASNRYAFAALNSNGTIYSWGAGGNGGIGSVTGTGYVDIYSSDNGFAAMKSDGSIYSWGGSSSSGYPVDSGYTKIFSTAGAFAAMKSDGSITAWGSSWYGGTGAEGIPIDDGYVSINGVCLN
ncbi:prepilin-type N-terminal cleavage/methylation domain-containing protein [Candidatus Gracilibacteria bacterium 28_42_T64]|nr:prepilin-type N-terminal cleavage/methylation domain-containing protein [Candidatus Gracilibacteria bacterium 28_42_T64]